jgi:DNA invertase Pin-like site-specific DNA recombinase/DNA-directed RNA polymerase subunit M/transcription elongation factor TFIIS
MVGFHPRRRDSKVALPPSKLGVIYAGADNEEQKRGIIYARVSSEEQKEEGYSLQSQIRILTGKMQNDEITAIHPPIEESESSRNNREGIAELLELAHSKQIKYVYVYSLDRLGRNVVETPYFLYLLNKEGVIVRTRDKEYNLDDPLQYVMVVLESYASDIETRKLAKRTQDGKKEKFRRGKWVGSKIPFACLKNKDDELELNQDISPIVFDIFTTFITVGTTIEELTRSIDDRYSAKIGKLSKGQVRGILANPIYTGRLRYAELEDFKASLAIIPKELFERVQSKIQNRANIHKQKTPRKPSSLLDTLVKKYGTDHLMRVLDILKPFCPKCNSAMVGNGSEQFKDMMIPKFICPSCGYQRIIPSKTELELLKDGLPHCPNCQSVVIICKKNLGGWVEEACLRCGETFQVKSRNKDISSVLTKIGKDRTLCDYYV